MKNYNYTKEGIVKTLVEVGIKKGDVLFSHSNIGFFGKLKDAEKPIEYYNAFKTAIFKVLGKEGTFVVPTFTYSFCWNKVFDKNNTPSTCGFLSEMLRQDVDSLRSDDANFSVAAIGRCAKYLTQSAPEHSFGKNSFWERFLNLDGKFCNLNFDSGSTFFHYVENCIGVEYRYEKPFKGVSLINGKQQEKKFYHYCRNLNKPEFYPDNTKFHNLAKKLGYLKISNLGKGQIVVVKSRDKFFLIRNRYKVDPNFLIKRV